MIYQLTPDKYQRAAAVLAGLAEWNVFVTAVLNQDSPGRIYVDHAVRPQAAFAVSLDCAYLAGSAHNDAFNAGVTQVLEDSLWAGDRVNPDDPELAICVDDPAWEPALADILGQWRWPPVWGENHYYLFANPKLDWRETLPSGYTIVRLEAELLNRQGAQLPQNLADNIRLGWHGRENFLANGFGFVALHGDEIVCWCLADVTSGRACEIGIETAVQHRRMGLATAVTTATVEYCRQVGFRHIGWHCGADNPGSIGTAVKVGFALERPYSFYSFHYDEPRHYAELGRLFFHEAQMYEEAADMLEIAIEVDSHPPAYVYFLAARALAQLQAPQALDYLQEAIKAGFKDRQLLQTLTEFDPYRQKSNWRDLWDAST